MPIPDRLSVQGSKQLLFDLGLREIDDDGENIFFEDPQNDESVVSIPSRFPSEIEVLLRDLAEIGIERDDVIHTYDTQTRFKLIDLE